MAGKILSTPGSALRSPVPDFCVDSVRPKLGSTHLLFERYTVFEYNVLGGAREMVVSGERCRMRPQAELGRC